MDEDIHKAKGRRAEAILKESLRKAGWKDAVVLATGISRDVEFDSRMEAGKRRKRAEKHRKTLDIFDDYPPQEGVDAKP